LTAPLSGAVAVPIGSGPVTGLNGSGIGLAFDASNSIRVLTNGGPNFYSVDTLANPPTGTSLATLPGGATTGDLASINVPNPDLSITKTDARTSIPAGSAQTYTIQVTNNSGYAVTGTVTDTVPASITGVSWTCLAPAGSSCAAASGTGNTINTYATLAPSGTATYTVSGTLSATAIGILTNTATVAVPA